MFSVGYAAEAAWNDARWQRERFNQLLVEARSEIDAARRHELNFEMQRIVRDHGGARVLRESKW